METKKTNRTIVIYSKKEPVDKNGKAIILNTLIKAINNLVQVFPQNILLEEKTFANEIKLSLQNIIPYDVSGSLNQVVNVLKQYNGLLQKLPVTEQNKSVLVFAKKLHDAKQAVKEAKKLIKQAAHKKLKNEITSAKQKAKQDKKLVKETKILAMQEANVVKNLYSYAKHKKIEIDIEKIKIINLSKIVDCLVNDLTIFLQNINTSERKVEFIANKISEFADCHKIDASVILAFNLFNVFRDFDNIFLGLNVVRHNEIIKLLCLEKQHEAKVFKAKKNAIKKVKGFKARWKQMDLLLDENRKTLAERKKPKFFLFTTYKWSMLACRLTQMSIKSAIARHYQCYAHSGWTASRVDANNPIVLESLKKWVQNKIS